MMKVILDTNIILTSVKYKIDLKSELSRILDYPFKMCIIDKTIDELKEKKDEKMALALVEQWGVKTIATAKDKNVDQLILNLEKEDIIVATQDKKLKEKLKKRKIPVIVIRQKRYAAHVE